MSRNSSGLNNLRVASPCSQDWNAMRGDERKRHCFECKLNVYNISGMTRSEAENLLQNAEGRLCVRYFQRTDGTILTQDCPVGWQAIKRRASRVATAVFAFLTGLTGGLLAHQTTRFRTQEATMGAVAISPQKIMGEIALPSPTPSRKHEDTTNEVMGRVAVIGVMSNSDPKK